MDALIDEIVAQTGMTRDMAAQAASITIDFLKNRLPSSTGSQIDGALLSAQARATAGQVAGKIESTFRR